MNAKNKITAQVPFIGTTKTTEPFFSVYIIEQKLILKGEEKKYKTKQVLVLNKQSQCLSSEAGHVGSFVFVPVLPLLRSSGSSCWFGHDDLYVQTDMEAYHTNRG